MIHWRLGIGGGQNLVRASVAILAVCSRPAGTVRAGMKAVRVSFLCVGVALCAANLPGRGVMRQALHILVAINASEQIAVDRMFQLAFIHIKADLLAVHLRGQGGVGVAGKAVFVLELMLGASRTGANKQRYGESLGEGFPGRGHAFEESLRRRNPQ